MNNPQYGIVFALDGSGSNECVHDDHRIAEGNWSWCGSNYDAKGNRRFVPYN